MQIIVLNHSNQKTSFNLGNFFVDDWSEYRSWRVVVKMRSIYPIPSKIEEKLYKSLGFIRFR